MFSKNRGLKTKSVGAFILFGILLMALGCEKPPAQGDMISIVDIPSWASPYYAAIAVLDSANGTLYGIGGIEAVGDDGTVVFEIKDPKGIPWTGKNKNYTVRLELFKEEPSLTTIAADNNEYEEICIWDGIALPIQTESITLNEADKPMGITSEIDAWQKKCQEAIDKYIGIVDTINAGNIYAIPQATAQIYVINPIISEVFKYKPKMTEKQKQLMQEILEKYENVIK
jgi:hypothetical protein